MKTGVILINIGSPEELSLKAVKNYLRKFLSDPKVVSLHYILRKILVNFVIVPFRSKNTLEAYKEVWQEHGSPLVTKSFDLEKKLQGSLEENYIVKFGMSYSNPSIESTLQYLLINSNCRKLIVIPMYPQYAEATNGSAIESVKRFIKKNKIKVDTQIINYFYNNHYYKAAISSLIDNKIISLGKYDHILFSYHGLPEKQVKKVCGTSSCNLISPCPDILNSNVKESDNSLCYRAQCYKTTQNIVTNLKIPANKYTTSFQSRLGRTPWIKPYTDETLPKLISKGIRSLVVVCPAFVTDCLETIEEIGIQAKKTWKKLGGSEFTLIPCLNDSGVWVNALKKIILES